MRKITLKSAWTYRTPGHTIEYSAGEHEVSNEIAAHAEAEGVIPKEKAGGATDQSAASRT